MKSHPTTVTQIQLDLQGLTMLIDEAVDKAINKRNSKSIETPPVFGKIPILDIFDKKLLSKPTLYKHVKAGTIKLYKLGGRSYVDAEEFNNCFRNVNISPR